MKVGEKLHIGRRVARRAGIFTHRVATAPFATIATLRAKAPERLLIAPQDLRTTDATIASEIYSGYFALAGKVVDLRGLSPFEAAAPSRNWARALAGFGWLRHLRAADTALARANARALVTDFLARNEKPDRSPAWEAGVAARRTLSFSIAITDHSRQRRSRLLPPLHAGADASAIFLERQIAARLVSGEDRLFAAISLAELALCAQVSASFQRRSTRLLATELGRQIYPDGGHINRNADTLIRLLLDLLPLRQVYAARAVAPPPELLTRSTGWYRCCGSCVMAMARSRSSTA